MQKLFNFLYRFRTFGLFLILEGFCAWLIIVYNNRYNAAFLNSSNTLAATVNRVSTNTNNYFKLKEISQRLVDENLLLRSQLARVNRGNLYINKDTSESRYTLFDAKVINNSFRRSMNYLTLDVGKEDGVEPGMGVLSGLGVVGQVKSVSRHFATVTSLLHRNLMISSSVQRTNTLCTVQWDGVSPMVADLKYIPRHIQLQKGDTVITSGYNAVFPEGVMIGTISDFSLEANDVFYSARVKLAVDFSSLHYVYLIKNSMKVEQDSLQKESEVLE